MTIRESRARAILIGALAVLGAVYVLQLVRPLHLEWDSVCYLQIAEQAAHGRGFSCPGCDRSHCPVLHPPGYPAVLAGLIRAGIANGTSFVILNLVCLLIALVAANEIWRREFDLGGTTRLFLAIVLLLWWPIFRLANNPLSEFVFLALSTTSIAVAMLAGRSAATAWRIGGVVIALVLAFAAFKVRTVGIALVPAIAWAALSKPEQLTWARNQVRARPGMFAAAGLGLIAIAALVLSRSQYVTGDLKTQFGRGVWGMLLQTWGYRLTEFGELVLNVPAGKLPGAVQPIVSAIGAGGIVLIAWLLWRRGRAIGAAEVFLLGVGAIMFIWPYKDARFWIPVFPVFLGLCAWASRSAMPATRRAMVPMMVAVALFVSVGAVGEMYNTRISLARDQFPFRFSDDYLGPAYRQAWGVRLPTDTAPADSTALHLLREFEPRARGR
jgi:hypothetical protein